MTTMQKALQDCVEALERLKKRDKANTCQHEETYRGGVIWEICQSCGAKWADDRGGKPKWKAPKEWSDAEFAIAQAKQVLAKSAIDKMVEITQELGLYPAPEAK